MTAFVELVVVYEFGKRPLCPTARGLVELIWKGAYGDRDGDVLDVEKRQLVFPVETSRRDRGVCQPVERDVFGNSVSNEAFSFSVEYVRHELVTPCVCI